MVLTTVKSASILVKTLPPVRDDSRTDPEYREPYSTEYLPRQYLDGGVEERICVRTANNHISVVSAWVRF